MATALAAVVGALITPKAALFTAALPPAHALKTLLTRRLRLRQAKKALDQTPPEIIDQVHQYNVELLNQGKKYEIRTPRRIQTLYVLHKDDLVLTHLDYPEWFQKDDPQLEALVKKARPC